MSSKSLISAQVKTSPWWHRWNTPSFGLPFSTVVPLESAFSYIRVSCRYEGWREGIEVFGEGLMTYLLWVTSIGPTWGVYWRSQILSLRCLWLLRYENGALQYMCYVHEIIHVYLCLWMSLEYGEVLKVLVFLPIIKYVVILRCHSL